MDKIEKGITIVITQNCNLNCIYCLRQNAFRMNEDISLSELKSLLIEIKKNDYSWVLTTGGEPFLHKYIFDYLEFLSKLELNTVIETNGCYITEQNITKIKSFQSKNKIQFLISLDSHIIEEHYNLRGQNSHQNAVTAIKILKTNNYWVHINRVITPSTMINNSIELYDFLNYCSLLNIDEVHLSKVIDIENKYHNLILNKIQIDKLKSIIENANHKLLNKQDCESLWKSSTDIHCLKLELGALCLTKNGISPCNFMPDIQLDSIDNVGNFLDKKKYISFMEYRNTTITKTGINNLDCSLCSHICKSNISNFVNK